MTQEAASNRLHNFILADKLTIDDTVEGFQLSLLLGNKVQSSQFKKLYATKFYEVFYEIASNISNPDYVDKFFYYFKEWQELYCCDFKKLYVMILLKQKDLIRDFEKLYEALKASCHVFDYIDESELFLKSLDELKTMYLKELADYHTHQTYRHITHYALNSRDMSVARKVLQEIPTSLGWMRDEIITHIATGLFNTNKDEAVAMLPSNLSNHSKYDIVKRIYESNPKEAQSILSELPPRFGYMFKIYKDADSMDEQDILSMIALFNDKLEVDKISHNAYDEILIALGCSIVDKFPLLAFSLIDMTKNNLPDELDIQQRVAEIFLMQGDLELGVEYFHKIDVDAMKTCALETVIKQSSDSKTLLLVQSLVDQIDNSLDRFFLYEELLQKIPIPFEKMYELSKNIKPYQEDSTKPYEYSSEYEEYFAF